MRLKVTEWVDATRWRWLLEDADGRFLADHTVQLDPSSREYRGFCKLGEYLDYHQPVKTPQDQLRALGRWVGEQVFGGLRAALKKRARSPAEAVQVLIPQAAHELLERPFEIACFEDGKGFSETGLRFVYQPEGAPEPAAKPLGSTLRILAVFSLPVRANPLNLRRERYGLQRLVRELNRTKGAAVELRVLQYGATRETLREALEEGEGWDLIHLSGHGLHGGLLLEKEDGGTDPIDAAKLSELLAPARDRLKLLILDACYSGASSHAAARALVGLEATRQEVAEGEAASETALTPLPSLGFELSERLDCAVLAMRYPVGDTFATDLMLSTYEKLLEKRQRLPGALHLGLAEALAADSARPPLSPVTPILLGPRAAALQLAPPKSTEKELALPARGLTIGFPPEPTRFVGRLQPMLRASQALAPESPLRGVLFYGMPGAGKSAGALELAYRHEEGRFSGHVWYKAPEADTDIAPALFNLLHEVQRQLNAPDLGLTTSLDDPARFRDYTLPRLRALLEENSLLLVLDNLETLLTESNQWRIPLWGEVMEALLAHDGLSRVVLTSRRQPAPLVGHERTQIEPIAALSFAESVLLARELANLKQLFTEDLPLLQRILRVVQGHPKLMELANAIAGDRQALAARVEAAETEIAARGEILDAFFAVGGAREGESRQDDAEFVETLHLWTRQAVARLSPAAELLFFFLCRLEPEDRVDFVVEATWKNFLQRLGSEHAAAMAALAEPERGVPSALDTLRAAGLIEVKRAEIEPAEVEQNRYTVHPGVAEAARAEADPAVLAAADVELGNFHIALLKHGERAESEGGGGVVIAAARRGVPYLMRAKRWSDASTLLESLLLRDERPEAIAFALPLLERIAANTVGFDRELSDAGVLARALMQAGRFDEAERMMRAVIARSVAKNDYRLASPVAGDLTNLLMVRGRLPEALKLSEEKVEYTRKAGLGPWTQLADEGWRLQVLAAMGRYEEVLSEVERLRPRMAALPEQSDAEEAVIPWNVREAVLDTGCNAAVYSSRWREAIALNAEIVEAKRARGATELDLAGTLFNAYGPMLSLKRFDEARTLLLRCRQVFEAERQVEYLGKVYGALADLEDESGARESAVRFEQLALGYNYQHGDPEVCAVSHNNLAGYLSKKDAEAGLVLAHLLAGTIIRLQTRSGLLAETLRSLAGLPLQAPPAFADVVAQVETVQGVRFNELFERLPRTATDGDAAIAAIWQMVAELRGKNAEAARQKKAVLDSMPSAIREAFEKNDNAALSEAFSALPQEEAEAVVKRLREAGLIGGGPDMREVLAEFEPLLQGIAAVAKGDDGHRAEIEAALPNLEANGWKLTEAVHRLWAGEHDESILIAGIDANSAQLVRRLLELVAS